MKKIIRYIIFISLFFVVPKNILADSFNLSISCPDSVLQGQSVTCDVYVSDPSFEINTLSATYSLSSGLSYKGFSSDLFTSAGSESSLSLTSGSVSTSGKIGTLSLDVLSTVNSNDVLNVSLDNVVANTNVLSTSATDNMRVKSSNNNLSSLSITGGILTPIFNSNTLEYSAIVSEDKITITGEKEDANAKISGTGESTLKYGLNELNVIVTSETNTEKKYVLKITRPDTRDSNNYLSSLMITNTNFEFNKAKTEYNLSTTASDIIISAAKESTSSTVIGDIGKKSLNYGLNKFSVKVVAENENIRNYVINITRVDTRSNNNYLKSISLSSGSIKFNKNTSTYNIDVDKDVDKMRISMTLEDSKAKIVDGSLVRNINLNSGNNIVYIKVQSEKGEIRTYKLNINRNDGKNSDATLKDLKISIGKIDFKPDKYEYKLSVEYQLKKIKVSATPNNEKSKVTIDKIEELEVGENTINITVEAENGAKNTYVLKITRKKEGDQVSSNNYIKYLVIEDHDLSFDKKVYEYELVTNKEKLDLSIVLDDEKATYEIIGNENLSDKSKIIIRVTAENKDVREYTITIKSSTNTYIILLLIALTLLMGAITYLIILNIKRKAKLNSMYKTKVEIIDEDFTEA